MIVFAYSNNIELAVGELQICAEAVMLPLLLSCFGAAEVNVSKCPLNKRLKGK